MVVILIIGIMTAVIVPNLMSKKDEANIQKVISDIKALETSLDFYKLSVGSYPSTDQSLSVLTVPVRGNKKPIIKQLSKDPWGSDYRYTFPSERAEEGSYLDYDLYSIGPDKEDGTDDDIGNFNLSKYQK